MCATPITHATGGRRVIRARDGAVRDQTKQKSFVMWGERKNEGKGEVREADAPEGNHIRPLRSRNKLSALSIPRKRRD